VVATTAHVVGLDAGTTGITALAIGADGATLARASREFPQHFPRPGWVEHDAREISAAVRTVLQALYETPGLHPGSAVALGLTNQRETAVVWDRRTGVPRAPAIVWQDRRTTDLCAAWRAAGLEPEVRRLTGLRLDPYFSASKLRWWLDAGMDPAGAAFGTIDSWLLWELTGGQVHATDFTNASRTLLYDIHARTWSEPLLRAFGLPRAWLPEVRPAVGRFGTTRGAAPLPDGLPITGIAGDQQAALFGQCCFEPGDWKNTYGTGCFLLVHTGTTPFESTAGLLTTLVCDARGAPAYALEGSVFTAGAAIQWLRDGLGLVADAAECAARALEVDDTGGVYLVPAFTGLGAPHWRPEARAALVGMSRGTTRAHVCRAAIEAMAYQTCDLHAAMCADVAAAAGEGFRFGTLRVDGGAARNDPLMQLQADLLDLEVDRPQQIETTAQGAAFLAGLGAGFWSDAGELAAARRSERRFVPQLAALEREPRLAGWRRAVQQVLDGCA
jgi:glycerol kinase